MRKQNAVFLMLFVLISGNVHGRLAEATVIGGHFWVLESELKRMHGVLQTVAGYYYKTPSNGHQGLGERTQAVKIIYNPKIISVQYLAGKLLKHSFPKALALRFCRNNASQIKAILAKDALRHRGYASSRAPSGDGLDAIIRPMQGHFRAADEVDQDYINEHPVQFWWYSLQCKTKRFFGVL